MSHLFLSIEDLVKLDHPYRKILSLVDFGSITRVLRGMKSEFNASYSVVQDFKMLLLQYMEDLSDRELERYLQENNAAKLFCDFDLCQKTPDHSYFGQSRSRIGNKRLADLFNGFRDSLKDAGLIQEVFTFVDASKLVSKVSLWDERDKVIKAGEEKLNNSNISKVSRDKNAKMGCKKKGDYWYGYKRVRSVDMQSGLINKATVFPANVHDSKTANAVCPDGGMVAMDKGYCSAKTDAAIKRKGAVPRAIKRNNMKDKNKDYDRWLTGIRSPYERVFSKEPHHTPYIGIAKNLFMETMQSIAFNCQRICKIADELGDKVPKEKLMFVG